MHIASYIDHTLLKPTATQKDIERLCGEAEQYQFAAVCVPPYYVSMAKKHLKATGVKTATVIGFPFGYSALTAKIEEIDQALSEDADELDMVICLTALKNGDWRYLEQEIAAVTPLLRKKNRALKVIIESGILTDQEIIRCCELYAKYQVQFLKTSTGYAERGARLEAVRLMRAHLPEDIQIKASGGIRTFAFAAELMEAGATRLGTSAGIRIVEEAAGLP